MKYAAFLRGINVGGKNKVGMADLRKMAAGAGLDRPQTLLQSGNLIFEGDERSESKLETLLEERHIETFGFAVDYHVRSLDHLGRIVGQNPFAREAEDDPSHLVVAFFKSPLRAEACETLRTAIRGREVFHEAGREAYVVYPDGIGDSKLTNAMLDSKLGQRGTARNWNTVLKLLALDD